MARNNIIICPPTTRSIRKISKIIGDNGYKWAFLSENVLKSLHMKKKIGDRGEQINITNILQENAHLLRESYLEYIGDLNVGESEWWATTISEKNPFISTTFLYICYLKVCYQLLTTYQATDLVIFVDNHALRKTIIKNYSNKYEIKYINNDAEDLLNILKDRIKTIAYKNHYALKHIQYILLVKYKYKLNTIQYAINNNPNVLVRDWIDYRSFDLNGYYQSAYLGSLNEYLISKGKSILILPYTSNINKKTLKLMINSDEYFIIPHSFLTIKNIFSKLFVKLPISTIYPLFNDLDITYLIKNDFKKDKQRFIDALLYVDIVKNLNDSNIHFDSCITLYENYVDEKMFCYSMKKYYPTSTIIGYQHSTSPKMLLSYYFTKQEAKIIPIPDKIVTNGPYFTNNFRDENYPPEKLITGGAIRYSYLYAKSDVRFDKDYEKTVYNILVTPSVSTNETLELLVKVIESFGNKEWCQITVKYHPAINHNIIKKYSELYPPNLNVSDDTVPELLKKTDLLVYTMTGAAVEALYAGVPILHIKSNYTIDLDMFNYERDDIYSAQNIDEIIEMSEELLQMDEKQLKAKQIIWKKIVREMFSPIDSTIYQLFGVGFDENN
ncbi:MAG: hypothetical protein U9N13_01930 [Euryarchaeota archaeon]|nr:hypothetical protein [Euryarchaeota archaeon]